jgi:hypothetical protein
VKFLRSWVIQSPELKSTWLAPKIHGVAWQASSHVGFGTKSTAGEVAERRDVRITDGGGSRQCSLCAKSLESLKRTSTFVFAVVGHLPVSKVVFSLTPNRLGSINRDNSTMT